MYIIYNFIKHVEDANSKLFPDVGMQSVWETIALESHRKYSIHFLKFLLAIKGKLKDKTMTVWSKNLHCSICWGQRLTHSLLAKNVVMGIMFR